MPAAVLTPYSKSAAKPEGTRLWRKRLLPVGEIDYKGQKIRFDPQYLEQLAGAFHSRAYDQVPFQLATASNEHNNLPERYAGEIAGMAVEPDGLYVTIATTDKGSKILQENPRLGVSARIVEDYARSDGKYFSGAVQHVLGTLDPRIPSLGPWTSVDLAGGDGLDVIDLSQSSYPADQETEGMMPELTTEQQARLAKLLDVPEDQFNKLLEGLPAEGAQPPQQTAAPADESDGGTEGDELTDEDLDRIIAAAQAASPDGDGSGLSDEELNQLMAEAGAEPAGSNFSNETVMAIELANARNDELERQMGVIQDKLDAEAYGTERRKFAEDCGIPPYIVDLAQPLLQGQGRTVELSNGSQVDAGHIVRTIFTELGKVGKMLDLSGEIGSAVTPPEGAGQEDAAAARADAVKRFRSQTGV